MKIKLMDTGKNLLFLLIILVILISTSVIVLLKMKSDTLGDYLSSEKILKILVVVEDDGKPLSTNVIAYYPETKRAVMFDIPSNTGLIIQSLNRTDGVGAVYTEKGIASFKDEIEDLTDISIPFYLTMSLDEFSALTDMLGGVSVFIPTPVDINTEAMRILLPSGSVTLDGDKIKDYLIYQDEDGNEREAASRRQKAILALLRAINDNSPDIFFKDRFVILENNIHSNLRGSDFKELLTQLCKLDSERLIPQRVTGAIRYVGEKKLLMPFREGHQLKQVIRQAIAVLASDDSSALERVYALEILNGTDKQGLARNTSELYQSFGYDVVNIGNYEEDIRETILIDRIGNPSVAKIVANVIHCENIKTTSLDENSEDEDLAYGSEANVDFTLILGSDFNGFTVIKRKKKE